MWHQAHLSVRKLEFLFDRLSPRGYLGLHLTVGVLLLIGASWQFGGIAQDVVAGDPLTVIDKNVAEHLKPGAGTWGRSWAHSSWFCWSASAQNAGTQPTGRLAYRPPNIVKDDRDGTIQSEPHL